MSEKTLEFSLERNYCMSCRICYWLCPKAVLAADAEDKPQVVNVAACIFCKLCEYRCPDFAIRVEGREHE